MANPAPTKVVALHPGDAWPEFLDAYREALLVPAVERLVINLVDVSVSGAPPAAMPYHAVTELWLSDLAAYGEVARTVRGRRPGAPAAFAYEVSERVQLEQTAPGAPGERSPGVKAVYLVRRRPHLSAAEARQRWSDHADTARRHHVGMSKYVQNGVRANLTPANPPVDAIAMLHFPTIADFATRMYDSEEGRQRIRAEADALVEEATPLYTSEYVLRP